MFGTSMQRFFMAGVIVAGLLTGGDSGQLPFPAPHKGERIVIVAPHPDDETLGAGGFIQEAVAAGAVVHVIYLTNGDHNQIAFKLYNHSLHLNAKEYEEFGEKRRKEAITATALLGLSTNDLTFLGYPDWGTLAIWRDYWEPGVAFTSDATRTNAVPYPEDYGYHHPYESANIMADMTDVLRKFKPDRVLVTNPVDTNRDHRAAGNYVRLALLQLAAEGLHPQLYFYLIHFGGWPRPVHYHPDVALTPPAVLANDYTWLYFPLQPDEVEKKYQAILDYRTQMTIGQYYLESFARSNELFATIGPDVVPFLPADQPLDLRKAVRSKTLTVVPTERSPAMDNPIPKPVPSTTVPLETVDFLRQQDNFIALIGLKNRLGKRTGVHLYLFPYKQGVAFDKMPKVELSLTLFGDLDVRVAGRRVIDHSVTVSTEGSQILIRVPMRLLGGGEVDHLFASASAHWGEIPPDDATWQLLKLEPAPKTP
jgi:LmbE family N-acetylglucosaminyl deacetylase